VPPTPEELAAALEALENGSAGSVNPGLVAQLQAAGQGESWAAIIGKIVKGTLTLAGVAAFVVGALYYLPLLAIDGALGLSSETLAWIGWKLGIAEDAVQIKAALMYMRGQLGDFWNWALGPVWRAMTRVSDWYRGGGWLTRAWRGLWRFTG
jgi:hypothetical protein